MSAGIDIAVCPSCNRVPFGVYQSAPELIDGEYLVSFSCGSCGYLAGVRVLPKGVIPVGSALVSWNRLVEGR